MSSSHAVAFSDLPGCDLLVDAIYEGGSSGTVADEPVARLLPVGNSGGFRYKGSASDPLLVALVSSGRDLDWPDNLNRETGIYTYFGDNRTPGSPLLETPRCGNRILTHAFDRLHRRSSEPVRHYPFLVFEHTGQGRDTRFLGLAVPGSAELEASEDLVAIWRTTGELRFQNYRARFTILDVPRVARTWIDALLDGDPFHSSCPEAFRAWAIDGQYAPLRAHRTRVYRSKGEQLPNDDELLRVIWSFFAERPTDFEACAATLWRMQYGPGVQDLEVTRATVDGGRDATGVISIGPESDPIRLDFGLEAKCYEPGNAAGVRDVARLISRLRHRQFGVFVTTSYLGPQAYRELRDDRHPVIVISGNDILNILRNHGITTADDLRRWLVQDFAGNL